MIYRGFALQTLRGRGMPTWKAVLLAALSFAFIHGIASLILLPMLLLFALLFSAIYLWRGNLWIVIVLHTLWDMLMVLAV